MTKKPNIARTEKVTPVTPEHVPSPCPNLTKFYFWDMAGNACSVFNSDPAVSQFVSSLFAVNARDAAELVNAKAANSCPHWALLINKTTGAEFQMTWRSR